MWTRTDPGSALVPLVWKVATRAKLGQRGSQPAAPGDLPGWLALCDILRSSKTSHEVSDRPRECFGDISLQSCDARQARLINNRAA